MAIVKTNEPGQAVTWGGFEQFKSAILSFLDNPFVKESFLDWCQDMEETDWTYYEAEPTAWQDNLIELGLVGVLRALARYRENWEIVAYQENYLPDNHGVDVRNWSNELTEFF